MKIEVESKKGLRTILSVIVDKKNIQTKMDERLKELQKEVNDIKKELNEITGTVKRKR